MIRPRIGDFVYTNAEMDVMLQDIHFFKEHGCQGIVVGVLEAGGRVSIEQVQRLGGATVY